MPGAARISTILLLNLSVSLSSSVLAQERKSPCELLVAAAADLSRTQPALSESFAKASGCRVRFSFGSSGMLAQQIVNGAPFDIYLSANQSFVDQVGRAGKLLPGSVRTYALGRLGLWSRSGRFRTVADLLHPDMHHLALANPAHAPYGMAAREALLNQGLWQKLGGKIVYGENVQQALQFAETGNADAVIAAWSLMYDRGAVLLPAAWHSPIRQVGAVVSATAHPAEARRFLDFLGGPQGREILRRFGFE